MTMRPGQSGRTFSSKVRDITEWLDQIMPADLPLPVGERAGVRGEVHITYHEPCHLANVQGVRQVNHGPCWRG